eukprot:m.859 g.859  ORF g.859 m.859 type:complete len:227 (+) comp334_c0_seq1:169-849(+)
MGEAEQGRPDTVGWEETTKREPSTLGRLVLAGCVGTTVAIAAVIVPFIAPGLRKVCLPYVPATTAQVENVVSALRQCRSKSMADIGSGDGRLVIAAATELGMRGTGYELNRWLVYYSRYAAWRSGVSSLTSFRKADLWKTDFSGYDSCSLFGVPGMLPELGAKLHREMRPEATVVVCRFPFGGVAPVAELGQGIDTVWTYKAKDLHSVVSTEASYETQSSDYVPPS